MGCVATPDNSAATPAVLDPLRGGRVAIDGEEEGK